MAKMPWAQDATVSGKKAERTWVGLRDLKTANDLATKREETESLRTHLKRDWALNRVFYNGQQWSFWNQQMLRVEDVPVDSGPKWKVKMTSNQIKPGLTHYVAQLTKTRPTIEAEPDSGEDNDVKSAEMAASLFEYIFESKHLNAKLQAVLMEAGLSGGYWKITWDPLASTPMSFVMDPNGQPILDDEMATAFIDQFSQMIQMPQDELREAITETVYLGDIRIDVMNAENVLVDPSVNRFDDANWVICKHSLDPDEIKARWGKTYVPNSNMANEIPMGTAAEKKDNSVLRDVYIMYIRPCPALQKGRYVVWTEAPNEILQDMDWPYPFTEIPLVKFPGQYRPNSPYDDPIVTEARPVQKDINKTLSQIVEHKNLTMRPQMIAPYGSLRSKLTSEPGALVEFNQMGNAPPPQWRELPPIPQYMFAHLQDLGMRMDRIFNRQTTTRDQIPARADSGHLLELMQEGVADQISPVILGIEDALAKAGKFIAAYAQKYYEEPRLIKVRGSNGSVQAKKFKGSDISGGFTFRPRYGTGLPRTREGKRAAIMELLGAGLIDQRAALKHLDLTDVNGVRAGIARDEDHALREHDKMRAGQPINDRAVRDAQQALEQFVQQAPQAAEMMMQQIVEQAIQQGQQPDPQTVEQQVVQQLQQQLQQLQQALQEAPWQPHMYEDVFAHVPVHMDFMKTQEFEAYPPELQDLFQKHLELSLAQMQQQHWMRADPANLPKVNITAKATTSAKVLAKILEAQGIPTDAQEVAEPPLETAVLDFVDKADMENTGNSQMDPMQQQLQMVQAQDEHQLAQAGHRHAAALAQAKVALDMANAQNAASLSGQKEQQAMDHAEGKQTAQEVQQYQSAAQSEEEHQQKLRHAEELHKAKVAAAKRPPAKPKGK